MRDCAGDSGEPEQFPTVGKLSMKLQLWILGGGRGASEGGALKVTCVFASSCTVGASRHAILSRLGEGGAELRGLGDANYSHF